MIKVLRRVNELGVEKFAPRAKAIDDDASFPVENYKDLADEGFLGLCIPEEYGGLGFSMWEYAMVGAEIGKYCGATALTFNMHNSSMAWSRFAYDMPNLTPEEKAAFAPLRERQFKRANDWPFGAALSFLLIYAMFILIAFQSMRANKVKEV